VIQSLLSSWFTTSTPPHLECHHGAFSCHFLILYAALPGLAHELLDRPHQAAGVGGSRSVGHRKKVRNGVAWGVPHEPCSRPPHGGANPRRARDTRTIEPHAQRLWLGAVAHQPGFDRDAHGRWE
jgi:hypothetical protein